MPQRTNLFQTVVYFIQMHLAGESSVIESAMLDDLLTGTPREVDVLVTGEIGGHPVRIGIECRDHRRAQSVSWVEEAQAKHSRLPTNVLVLVSSSGFTKEAVRVAEKYGIELVVPGSADEDAARSIVGRLSSLWYKEVSFTATLVNFETMDAFDASREAFLGPEIYTSEGTPLGTLFDLINSLMKNWDVSEIMRDATGEEDRFTFIAENPKLAEGADGAPQFLYSKVQSGDLERLVQISKVIGEGTAEIVVKEVPLSHAELRGTSFSYGRTTFAEREVTLVVTEPSESTGKVTVRVAPISKQPRSNGLGIAPTTTTGPVKSAETPTTD